MCDPRKGWWESVCVCGGGRGRGGVVKVISRLIFMYWKSFDKWVCPWRSRVECVCRYNSSSYTVYKRLFPVWEEWWPLFKSVLRPIGSNQSRDQLIQISPETNRFKSVLRPIGSNQSWDQSVQISLETNQFKSVLRPISSNQSWDQSVQISLETNRFKSVLRPIGSNQSWDQSVQTSLETNRFKSVLRPIDRPIDMGLCCSYAFVCAPKHHYTYPDCPS